MSIDNMRARLSYRGGIHRVDRLEKSKLDGLLKAIGNSYHTETILLQDGRKFKCLINRNRENDDYNDKMLSIPFETIELDSGAPQETLIKCGDTFEWVETNTHWLIYFRYYEETAYFKGLVRECEDEIAIDGRKYWGYIRGPQETRALWHNKSGVIWNDLNYTMILYLTGDEFTRDKLKRFSVINITNKWGEERPWEVQAINDVTGDGILEVALKEYYTDKYNIEDNAVIEEEENNSPTEDIYIDGPNKVKQFDEVLYKVSSGEIGKWYADNKFIGNGSEIAVQVDKRSGEILIEFISDNKKLSKTATIQKI